MSPSRFVVLAAAVATALGCASFPTAEETRIVGEQLVKDGYPGMPETLTRRAIQDADQKLCSKVAGEKLNAEEATQIVQSARASIRYPDNGRLSGDWKVGEQLANSAAGMRIRDGRVEQVKENGALCINCHALDPKEVNAGNLGPPLTGYGVRNGNTEGAVKYAYEKIYNAWAYFPCSNMPRLGHNGYLTPQQIAHVVAYLVDPQSPINKK